MRFHSQLLQKWFYAKTRINILPVFIKFTITLIYLLTFCVFQQDVPDPEELNGPVNVSTDSDVNHTLSAGCRYGSMTNTQSTIIMIYLMIHSAINLLHDIFGWVFCRFIEKHIYRAELHHKGQKETCAESGCVLRSNFCLSFVSSHWSTLHSRTRQFIQLFCEPITSRSICSIHPIHGTVCPSDRPLRSDDAVYAVHYAAISHCFLLHMLTLDIPLQEPCSLRQ